MNHSVHVLPYEGKSISRGELRGVLQALRCAVGGEMVIQPAALKELNVGAAGAWVSDIRVQGCMVHQPERGRVFLRGGGVAG